MTEDQLPQALGMPAPRRTARLVDEAVRVLELDFAGATVVTEAATGAWAAAPVLAAKCGATVHAITKDSVHGSAASAIANVRHFAALAGVPDSAIEFHHNRQSLPDDVDVLTNLGHVRPLDSDMLARLGPSGVVSVMFESWELRRNEIDVSYCRQHGIPIGAVWEDFGSMRVFASCGMLALKQCFSADLEVAGNRIIVISPDPFGDVIAKSLRDNHADVIVVADASHLSEDSLLDADAVLVADYHAVAPVLGGEMWPSPRELAELNPDLAVIQFVGPVDVESLTAAGVTVSPPHQLQPQQMAATLDELGLRPAIFLHAGGLKVGELLWRQRRFGQPFGAFEQLVQIV